MQYLKYFVMTCVSVDQAAIGLPWTASHTVFSVDGGAWRPTTWIRYYILPTYFALFRDICRVKTQFTPYEDARGLYLMCV